MATTADLRAKITALRDALTANDFDVSGKVVGIFAGSQVDFFACDLCIMQNEAISLPIPLEFTDAQIRHLLQNCDLALCTDRFGAQRLLGIAPELPIFCASSLSYVSSGHAHTSIGPKLRKLGVSKVIHTSGTTDLPKGVLVTDSALGRMLDNLSECVSPLGPIYAASVFPHSTLIEQLLSFYLPLTTGGRTHLLPTPLGSFTTTAAEAASYIEALCEIPFNFVFLPPRLLEELLVFADEWRLRDLAPAQVFQSNRKAILATGGAPSGAHVLRSLTDYGFEVLQGYGLSENTSVVSWNTLSANKIGSSGKPLPNTVIKFSPDGEILINSPTLAAGYLSEPRQILPLAIGPDGFLATGDLGYVDDDGYLFIEGRNTDVLSLSHGRNVNLAWVEARLRESSLLQNAIALAAGLDHLETYRHG
ncbi:MAG: AMP-binding protein [Bdellovibrionota bacterium]